MMDMGPVAPRMAPLARPIRRHPIVLVQQQDCPKIHSERGSVCSSLMMMNDQMDWRTISGLLCMVSDRGLKMPVA